MNNYVIIKLTSDDVIHHKEKILFTALKRQENLNGIMGVVNTQEGFYVIFKNGEMSRFLFPKNYIRNARTGNIKVGQRYRLRKE